jgi:hypothetical protein
VFISKSGKTYDTADGSEQNAQGSSMPAHSRAQWVGHWEDDGGPASDPPPPMTLQPAWSVLSLRDLNEAIRRELRGDDPVRLRLEAQRSERRAEKVRQLAILEEADSARATTNRFRNAWENT